MREQKYFIIIWQFPSIHSLINWTELFASFRTWPSFFTLWRLQWCIKSETPLFPSIWRSFIIFVPRCIDIVLGTDSLSLPKCGTSFAQQSFIHHVARVWNTVPSNIQSSPNVNLFKFNLKKCLLSKFLNS